MRINATQTIKERLTMFDVCQQYGFEPNRADFICCPFHNEKTPSMKIYRGDKGYSCFGCGASGDVISFVQKLFNLSFQETLKKIDNDFCLNIYSDKSFEELRKMHYQQKQFEAKKEREKAEKEQAENEYWQVFDEWKRLDDNFKKYKPKTGNEELHPLFVEALQKIALQEYLLGCFEMRRNRE
jgi:DNA primase